MGVGARARQFPDRHDQRGKFSARGDARVDGSDEVAAHSARGDGIWRCEVSFRNWGVSRRESRLFCHSRVLASRFYGRIADIGHRKKAVGIADSVWTLSGGGGVDLA